MPDAHPTSTTAAFLTQRWSAHSAVIIAPVIPAPIKSNWIASSIIFANRSPRVAGRNAQGYFGICSRRPQYAPSVIHSSNLAAGR